MTATTNVTRRLAASILVNLALAATTGAQPLGASAGTTASAEPLVRFDRLTFEGVPTAQLSAYEGEEVWRRAVIAGVGMTPSGELLVTVPRWLDARVPASLARVVRRDGHPALVPWLSAEANSLANPDGLRSVLGIRADGQGRIWALDMGWVAGEEGPILAGAAKLVAFDAATEHEVRRIAFGPEIAKPGSFFNDIALDAARGVAFISDSGARGAPENPTSIIVVDLATGEARRVLERHASTANNRDFALIASGEPVFPGNPLQVGVNGVALSPDGATLYWGLTTGSGIFKAPTRLLRDPAVTAELLGDAVRPVASPAAIDGMVTDAEGRLLVAGLTAGAILRIEPGTGRIERLAAPRNTV